MDVETGLSALIPTLSVAIVTELVSNLSEVFSPLLFTTSFHVGRAPPCQKCLSCKTEVGTTAHPQGGYRKLKVGLFLYLFHFFVVLFISHLLWWFVILPSWRFVGLRALEAILSLAGALFSINLLLWSTFCRCCSIVRHSAFLIRKKHIEFILVRSREIQELS